MKELFTSILDNSKERIRNPFIGSFISSWVVFNWKPIVYLLFSKDIIENKILFISQQYCSLSFNLFYPLAFAIFYIIVLPYIMWGFEELYTKAKMERLKNKLSEDIQNIKNKQTITIEGLKLENIKAEYKETEELNKKIEKLENNLSDKDKIIEQLNDENDEMKKNNYTLSNTLQKLQSETITSAEESRLDNEYELFKKSQILEEFKIVCSHSTLGFNIPNSLINDVIAKKLSYDGIATYAEMDGSKMFYLTKKGKYFWNKYLSQLVLAGKI